MGRKFRMDWITIRDEIETPDDAPGTFYCDDAAELHAEITSRVNGTILHVTQQDITEYWEAGTCTPLPIAESTPSLQRVPTRTQDGEPLPERPAKETAMTHVRVEIAATDLPAGPSFRD